MGGVSNSVNSEKLKEEKQAAMNSVATGKSVLPRGGAG